MSKTLSANHIHRLRTLARQPLQLSDARSMAMLEVYAKGDRQLRQDSALIAREPQLRGIRFDAADTIWFARELENVDTRIYMAPLIPTVARQVVPIDKSIPSWATSHRWREFVRQGRAELISSYANIVPMVSMSGTEYLKDIKAYGIGWGWSVKDIETSARTGAQLDITLAAIAREAIERTIDEVLLLGDARTGAQGLLKLTGIPIVTAPTVTGGGIIWTPAALGTEIVGAFLTLADKVCDAYGTAEGIKVNFLVPPKVNRRLDLPMTGLTGDAGGKTIKQYLKDNYGDRIGKIIESPRNATAGVGGVGRIMAMPAFSSEQEALTYVFGLVPEEFKTHPGQWHDLWWKQIGTMSCGGVGVRMPDFFAYMDGMVAAP